MGQIRRRETEATTAELVFMWDFYFREAARRRSVNCRYNSLQMEPDGRPLLISEHHNGNLSTGKILLITNVLVRGQEQFVAGVLGLPEQFTIREFVPTDLSCKGHFVSGESAGDGVRGAVIEENSHP